MSNKGVLYLAVGESFIDEAIQSARSVKSQMDTEIAIVTDHPAYVESQHEGLFEYIKPFPDAEQVEIEDRTWLFNSPLKPSYSPFEKTLFLDSDTYLVDDCREIFDLLDDYDLAVSKQPEHKPVHGLPACWGELNVGVLAYTSAANTVLSDWNDIYYAEVESQDRPVEQPAFAKALYQSDIRWFDLPRRYNVRFPRQGALAHDPKIIHGRGEFEYEALAAELSEANDLRLFWTANQFRLRTARVKDRHSLLYYVRKSLQRHGLLTTANIGLHFLTDRLFGTDLMGNHEETRLG